MTSRVASFPLFSRCMLLTIAGLLASIAQADVTPDPYFTSHMVLQQGMPLPITGSDEPGQKVTVTFAGHEATATADAQGRWKATLPALTAKAGPQEGQPLVITGSSTRTLENVLVGEVWLCSGQSNMAWSLATVDKDRTEINQANNPMIRLLAVPGNRQTQPVDIFDAKWRSVEPGTVLNFSAVAYFYGKQLQSELNIPIGLVEAAVGGTRVDEWMSHEAWLSQTPSFQKEFEDWYVPGHELKKALEAYPIARDAYLQAVAEIRALETSADEIARHTAIAHDDSGWQSMNLPTYFDRHEIARTSMVWYRKTVELPQSMAGKPLEIHLGRLSTADAVWFNGQLVGQTGSLAKFNRSDASINRVYTIPAELVKQGSNVIAMRVSHMSTGRGGVQGGGDMMYLVSADAQPAAQVNDASEKAAAAMKMREQAAAGREVVSLAGPWKYRVAMELPDIPEDPSRRRGPVMLYNGMIAPLVGLPIRGALWYQGESNRNNGEQYAAWLTAMIQNWRTQWGQGDFPFLIVQLPNLGRASRTPEEFTGFAPVRHAQAAVARTVPNTYITVNIDIGDPGDIHPRNKADFAHRLGLVALEKVYDKPIESSGPRLRAFTIQGSEMHLTFDHAGDGLVIKGDKLEGFAIAGEDGAYVWADAKLKGKDTVVISSPMVKTPVAASYAWQGNPASTLYNPAGLPTMPFKTDAK